MSHDHGEFHRITGSERLLWSCVDHFSVGQVLHPCGIFGLRIVVDLSRLLGEVGRRCSASPACAVSVPKRPARRRKRKMRRILLLPRQVDRRLRKRWRRRLTTKKLLVERMIFLLLVFRRRWTFSRLDPVRRVSRHRRRWQAHVSFVTLRWRCAALALFVIDGFETFELLF